MSSLAAAAAAAAALSSECREKSDQINKSNLLMLGSMENDEKVNKVNLKEFKLNLHLIEIKKAIIIYLYVDNTSESVFQLK
jgi:hypothetical protein